MKDGMRCGLSLPAVLLVVWTAVDSTTLAHLTATGVNSAGAANCSPTVLNAFDILLNRRDYASAERFWSPRYIQHSAHIPPGREGLFGLIKSLPATLRYENP
jgi:hypothetical protein